MECVRLIVPQRVAQKLTSVFKIKFNCNRMKSATKFRCVKNSSSRVVEQSVSYEITEKYTMESVSFHLKYWLKLTYPVVASTCMLSQRMLSRPWSRQRTALPNDVMSKIECGQLHSVLLGRRHNTQQSHGLFVLAKPLLFFVTKDIITSRCTR